MKKETSFTEGKILQPLILFAFPVLLALFLQSMSAFVAQNYGAGHMKRAGKALHYGIAVSFDIGVLMFWITGSGIVPDEYPEKYQIIF